MEYKAQLVIRSREREGVELIDKIKELAGEEGKTFSETALDLLALGLERHQGADAHAPAPAPAKAADEPAQPAAKQPEVSDAKPEKAQAAEQKPAEKTPAPVAAAKSVAARDSSAGEPASPAAEVAQKCIAQVEAEEPQAATQTLAGFFGKVGPIQGGRVKNLLQAKLSETDYNYLMRNLRKTREYRSYRQRVIFER